MANLNGWTKAASISIGICLLVLGICSPTRAQDPPAYEVDAAWPKPLPNNWIMGQVGGMAVDKNNHIWVLQRPSSNVKNTLGWEKKVSLCGPSAPRVLKLDGRGTLLNSGGGPGNG